MLIYSIINLSEHNTVSEGEIMTQSPISCIASTFCFVLFCFDKEKLWESLNKIGALSVASDKVSFISLIFNHNQYPISFGVLKILMICLFVCLFFFDQIFGEVKDYISTTLVKEL